MIQRLKHAYGVLFSFFVSILCGMLAAYALAVPVLAQALNGDMPSGGPGLEVLGPGALISVLCWLLQDSTKSRVIEAKESTERVREIFESQLVRDREVQAEQRAYLDRILGAYERLIPNSQKPVPDPAHT